MVDMASPNSTTQSEQTPPNQPVIKGFPYRIKQQRLQYDTKSQACY